MKWSISASALCAALLFMGSAVPGQATTLSFTSALTGGDITTSFPLGANDPVTGLVDVPFDTLVVSGAPANNGTYAPLFLQLNLNTTTDVLSLSGSIAGLSGLAAPSTLVSIQLSSGLTANTSTSASSLNLPSSASITSITISSVLLADLGLTGVPATLTGLTDIGQSCCADGGNYVSTSGSLVLTMNAVPEPGSLLLVLSGLFLSGLALRKRTSTIS